MQCDWWRILRHDWWARWQHSHNRNAQNNHTASNYPPWHTYRGGLGLFTWYTLQSLPRLRHQGSRRLGVGLRIRSLRFAQLRTECRYVTHGLVALLLCSFLDFDPRW